LLVGIPLIDIKGPWNGNFTLFRKSHQSINKMIIEDYQTFVENYKFKDHPKLNNPLQLECNRGDVFFVHPLVAHRAGPNYSPYIRPVIYFRITYKRKQLMQSEILKNMYLEFPGLNTES
jgi:ectoine hydroxylase-related dioxygenase (phytanoyl-CoA dioxygenase family)